MREYYTVDEVAKLLKLHQKTIQRYIREGKLQAKKVGKNWRITGHDVSVFAENTGIGEANTTNQIKDNIKVSSVIDIQENDFEKATHIVAMLISALNGKPSEYGKSTMHIQHLEYENKIRISLWGELAFVQKMFEITSIVVQQIDENDVDKEEREQEKEN